MTTMEPVSGSDVIRSRWVTLEQVQGAVSGAARDFAELLRSLGPDDADRPVPGLEWSVAETAAHVVSLLRRGDRRAATLEELADLNAVQIGEMDTRDPLALADMLVSDVDAVMGLLAGLPAHVDIPLHMGLRADAATVCSYILADLQVHGHDIATATRRPWTIDEQRAGVTLLALLPAIRPWVDPSVVDGEPRAVAFHFTGFDEPLVVRAGGGAFDVSRTAPAGSERSDARPSAVLLAMARGRASGDPVADAFGSWFLPI